jgi:C4-dicarboxylate-specific signal transduction histidine kinase
MMGTVWKPLLVVAGLLLLLTYLLLQSRSPDLALRARMYEALHAFEIYDAELNRDVLLVRAGLLMHYDFLSQAIDGLYGAMGTLQAWSGAVAGAAAPAGIGPQLADLAAAVQQKETLLEYFKADNALLQNSLMYFMHTGHALSAQTTARDEAVAAAIGALSNAMLRFVQSPQRQVSDEIEAVLGRLPTGLWSEQDFHTLAAHGRLIVDVLPEVDATLRQLLATPTTTHARGLRDASVQYYNRVEARAQAFRLLLYAVAVVLLAYLVYLFARLRANARALARVNTDLRREMAERSQLEHKTRQQELQLIQANKMTALGTLVAGVAHEINNPNQLVLMNARVLAESWTDAMRILEAYHREHKDFLLGGLPYTEMRQTIPALIRDMHDGARRIERIIDNLKDFARPRGHAGQATLHLNDAVQRALALLHYLINKSTTRFHVDLVEDLPPLRGNAQHIEQVVVNLVVNALEALPQRDRGVSVSTRHNQAEHALELEVRDEGIGIPPEHLARLCDPFFTTKQEQGGTGLGLAITYTLVRNHGGSMAFESVPGQGTRVLVTLPCLSEPLQSPSEGGACCRRARDRLPLPAATVWAEGPAGPLP